MKKRLSLSLIVASALMVLGVVGSASANPPHHHWHYRAFMAHHHHPRAWFMAHHYYWRHGGWYSRY